VWDRIEENEFAAVVTASVAALFPGDAPSFLKRTPHGYHDEARIRGELAAAGFTRVTVETIEQRSQAPGYRDPGRLGEATDAAAAALGARFGFGPIDGKMQAHVITASL
jgi:hypothetical protein